MSGVSAPTFACQFCCARIAGGKPETTSVSKPMKMRGGRTALNIFMVDLLFRSRRSPVGLSLATPAHGIRLRIRLGKAKRDPGLEEDGTYPHSGPRKRTDSSCRRQVA